MASVFYDIECEFCGLRNKKLVDPKKLPCGHIHCMPCLTSHYEQSKICWCGFQSCGKVYKMSPESLADNDVDAARLCDTCAKRGQHKRQATSYCTDCSRKFCKEHLEQHDNALDGHHKISMAQYLSNKSQNLSDICTKHENQLLVFGCKVCRTTSCVKCVADSTKCEKGGPHDLQELEDLAASLLNTINTEESTTKDEEYERLFKEVSKVQADFDEETQAMLLLIHKSRDSQLNEIKVKYDTLEKHVLENRQQSQAKIADFIEDELLKQWNSLRTNKELLVTGTKSHTPAAIVRGFGKLKAELNRIAKEDLPELRLTDQLKLRHTGERREIEVQIFSSHSIIVEEQKAPPVPKRLPKSLIKLSSVPLPSRPLSICHYKADGEMTAQSAA
ncbi:transcription intermediary factor 1-beta-like [Watersipora subatra]|uniref:transcription intermediary factor 1-beta-like n=1 Tax=Watersipora subatra TaxID=2589382 RepID=UPI00355C2DB2